MPQWELNTMTPSAMRCMTKNEKFFMPKQTKAQGKVTEDRQMCSSLYKTDPQNERMYRFQ